MSYMYGGPCDLCVHESREPDSEPCASCDNGNKWESRDLAALRARAEKAEAALEMIATTFPTALGLNGGAYTSDPDTVKMRNNHMTIAQEALAGKGE